MGLRVVDLSKLDEEYMPQMTSEEYRAELQKPRSERRGLSQMPADMCISPENEDKFIQAITAYHQCSKADKARAVANGCMSNCL